MAGKKTALTAEEKLAQALVPQEEWPYELPKGWVWTRVGDINKFQAKSCTPKNEPSQNFEMYSVPSYAENYPEILKGKEIGSSKQLVQKDDILLCKINPRINRVWKVSRFTDNPLLASSEWIVIRNNILLPDYLMWYFRSSYFREYMLSNVSGVGGSLMRAQPKFVKTYPIPLPPLPEQQRIVDKIQSLFARLDEARDKLQQVLEGTEARRAAILHEAFSGGWGKRNSAECSGKSEEGVQEADGTVSVPEGWKKITLGDAYDLKAGKNIKAKEIYEKKDVHHPYPCYGGNGIRGYVQSFNREGLHPIIGRQGALCGNVNMADGEFYATEHAVVVTDKIPSNAVWTYYYLTYLNLNQYATSTAQPGLAVSNLNKIWIILPPLEVQQKVAEKLVSLYKKEDAAQKACESALAQIDLLKKAILARAFRGELGTGDPNDPSALDLLEQSL